MRSVCIFILALFTLSTCVDNNVFNPITQLKSDTAAIRSFLTYNNIEATKISQGVWYSIDDSALGFYPALADSVVINFTVRQIPSDVAQGTPISSLPIVGSSATTKSPSRTVLLSSVISGMQLGLSRFPVGSTGKLFIPSGLAFGPSGYDSIPGKSSIPANANLVYEITLVKATGSRLAAEQTAISSYISTISDNLLLQGFIVRTDSASGIRYSYDTIKSSQPRPNLKSLDSISYTGNILNASTNFISSTDTTLVLKDQIAAFQIIFPKINVGKTFTVFVPASYGYGSYSPSTAIPANSNLVYQITLIGIH